MQKPTTPLRSRPNCWPCSPTTQPLQPAPTHSNSLQPFNSFSPTKKRKIIMENNLIPLGIDAGNGAFKLFGAPGGLELVSQVSTNGTQKMLSTLGLRKQKAPLQIANESGSFYVGTGAHDYGRPVENLDVDR